MSWYDQVEIEDMTYDPMTQLLHYPCPCGDRFEVCIDDLLDGSTDIATCPSCSLTIQLVFEVADLEKMLTSSRSSQMIATN
jgi:diphthamide biosynthesis protein 3